MTSSTATQTHSSTDNNISELRTHADEWAQLAMSRKIDLLKQCRAQLRVVAEEWVRLGLQAKRIEPNTPWEAEEWINGPWALAYYMSSLLDTLSALANSKSPVSKFRTRPNGQLAVHAFPLNTFEKLLLNGLTAEVWMQPGVTEANLQEHVASFYRQTNPVGKVALVLGAGNLGSIPALDALYKLYAEGAVIIVKMNPVNDYLTPVLQQVFAPLVDGGFVRIVTGDGAVGAQLVTHPDVDEIHITGSERTHDAIVFGPGAEGTTRKQHNQPLLTKPITSELGGVCPVVVVPGPWDKDDVAFQAENIFIMRFQNSGFNCIAAQTLVLPQARVWPQSDKLLDELRRLMHSVPARHAYYPGAAQRQQAVASSTNVETFTGDVPRTLVTDIECNASHHLFDEEVFGPVLAQTSLPGNTASDYLRNAVRFCNEQLAGTLGATLLIHPHTIRELGSELDDALEGLRYGSIGVNIWAAGGFLLPTSAWGAYSGNTLNNVGSGIGVVRNAFLLDNTEKTVLRGVFRPMPRAWKHGEFHLSPKPIWFATHANAHVAARRVAYFSMHQDGGTCRVFLRRHCELD